MKEFFCISDAEAFVGKIFGIVVVVELAVGSTPLPIIINVLKKNEILT